MWEAWLGLTTARRGIYSMLVCGKATTERETCALPQYALVNSKNVLKWAADGCGASVLPCSGRGVDALSRQCEQSTRQSSSVAKAEATCLYGARLLRACR
jgi:hypothetical protein